MAQIVREECTATRVYIRTAFGEPMVEWLRAQHAHWDADKKLWWLGAKKRKLVELALESGFAFNTNDKVERAIRADQLEERGAQAAADELRKPVPPEDAHKVEIFGRATYQRRSYYMGRKSRDGAAVRLYTLPDKEGNYRAFWAKVAEVTVTNTYRPRERGYGRYRTTAQQTLGGMADFIRRQQNAETRRGQCTECGGWGPFGQVCEECHEGTHI